MRNRSARKPNTSEPTAKAQPKASSRLPYCASLNPSSRVTRTEALAKDGNAITTHAFAKAGDYIVSVEHENERGERAIAHLWVGVGE